VVLSNRLLVLRRVTAFLTRPCVYPPCTQVPQFGRFWRFWRYVKSITCVYSEAARGATPTQGTSLSI
jgi:hypothetical protein